eukprot:jgi/Mesvir1/18439/Mv14300-RA.1
MARKKIREYDSKRLLREHLKRLAQLDVDIKSAQVTAETDAGQLVTEQPWLLNSKLVVKPDMLFGKRGKSGLVGLNLDFAAAMEFIKERMGKEVQVGASRGTVTTFIVEPFIPHDTEFYLSITSTRTGNTVSFSECGGIDIEENWDKLKSVEVPITSKLTGGLCAPLIASLPLEVRSKMEAFLIGCFDVYSDLDFSMLEMNPLTLVDGAPFPLDMRGELDDCAGYRNKSKWGNVEFPLPFGRNLSKQEAAILQMDESTGASLKLTILNPAGHIWTMVAGGGASVIYADTVGDLGMAEELGNYAEYSGAPNEQETYGYAQKLLEAATAQLDGRPKALIVGGGIANFTDVAVTFKGIIRAMREMAPRMKAANMHVYVRRGGPNYKTGLENMRKLGQEIGVPFQVFGPEATMTGICKLAIDFVRSSAAAA